MNQTAEEQFEEMMEDYFSPQQLQEMSDDEIEDFRQQYYAQRPRVQRRPRRRNNGALGALLGIFIVAAVVIGVGAWAFNQFSGGTVSANPTAAAMYTEASQILTQVAGGQQAVITGSTPELAQILPTPQCINHVITELSCNPDGTGCYYVMSESDGQHIPVDPTFYQSLKLNMYIAQTCK